MLLLFGNVFWSLPPPAFSQDILYPFGPAYRDLETPKMDDGSSPEIPILIPFIYFAIPYRSLYVSLLCL